VLQTIKDRFFIPIIAISGIYESNEIIDRIDDLYIDQFFKKPLNLETLLAGIQKILHG
jgi:response regulator RpfG family c-di-GMP phosphodiesterase